MEWTITLAAIGVSLAATAFAAWQAGRPRKDTIDTRWIPWRFVTLVSGAIMLLGFVHAMNLLGLHVEGAPGGLARP